MCVLRDVARDSARRFQRAIQRGQLFHAELVARELGRLTLADALALVALIAKEDPARYVGLRSAGTGGSRSR